MRLLLLLLLMPFLVCGHASDSRAESGFLKEIDDVAIPDGFAASDDDAVTYDTPAGRIVETSIVGDGTEATIEKFYTETLPQVGWEKTGGTPGEDNDITESEKPNLTFAKEGEIMDIFFLHVDDRLMVKFSLYPSQK